MQGCDFFNNTQLAEHVSDSGHAVLPVTVFSEYAISKYAKRWVSLLAHVIPKWNCRGMCGFRPIHRNFVNIYCL
jgi:hypothetical protein